MLEIVETLYTFTSTTKKLYEIDPSSLNNYWVNQWNLNEDLLYYFVNGLEFYPYGQNLQIS